MKIDSDDDLYLEKTLTMINFVILIKYVLIKTTTSITIAQF